MGTGEDLLRHRMRVRTLAYAGKRDGELVTAQSGTASVATHRVGQALREQLEPAVTGAMFFC